MKRKQKKIYKHRKSESGYMSVKADQIGKLAAQVDWLGLRVGSHLALSLHSSNEPGELSQ